MKNLLVPTDFSECALSALKVAVKLADKLNATITLVHTYAVPVYGFTSGHLMYDGKQMTKLKEEIHDELKRIASMDFIKGQKVKTLLLPDYSLNEMIKHESLKDTDLIVMGTHGASGLKELIGSNTEKLIRHANCPVLAIKEGSEDDFNPKNIVFASTFYGEVYEQFPNVKAFSELFNSKIHLLFVNTPRNFITSEYCENLMMSFKEKFKLNHASINIYNDVSVEDGVINFCKKIEADVVVIETHGRTGLNHLINGSITEDVTNHISIPVLTFRIKEAPKSTGVIFPDSH